ncbi:pseudaminic acid biosynthesis-associated methylase [Emcibacter nanhaiensis]|uniref:Methyltransferase domain-containing protein n=1 Tax=Emcibacter nanhaiensis TaxID=1505037 RepID=A0A501PS86_9PROT|nr:pseudaminic acid biosynthesis-associated methylase [Emcibacter nanhaiensis]TPD62824.1 methyltransferase domain-containing protein [Emcibacter nanhaiensis]
MNTSNTEQTSFWRGEFGDEYIDRNAADAEHLRNRLAMWSRIIAPMRDEMPKRILEIGSNIGLNLRALNLLTDAEMVAVEPNEKARKILVDDKVVAPGNAIEGVASEFDLADGAVDMAFTCTVMIHIHPDDLLAACKRIHRATSKYVVCIEYFSDKQEMIEYRGHSNKLFKCDFGGFWMDNFPDLKLLDYGFEWKRITGLDNFTWWVFEKK